MAKDIDYYRKISGSYETANKQEATKLSIANSFSRNFNDNTLGYAQVFINNISRDVIIQNKAYKNNVFIVKEIIMKPNDVIDVGDLIVWDNKKWLCIQSDNTHNIYYTGTIRECKHVIKFYDDNMTLLQADCIVNGGILDLNQTQYISTSNDSNYLYCQNNNSTKNINLNTRFIIGTDAFVVNGIDSISNLGMIEIQLKKDQITVNDNIELGIADYGLNQITNEINILNGESAELFYQNTTLQLVVQAKANGVVVSNPIVSYVSSNVNVAVVSNSGLITCVGTGNCVVTVNYMGVSDVIDIKGVETVTNDYNITIDPLDNTIVFGKSKTFTATILNNGMPSNISNCLWSVVNSDGSDISYANVTTNNLICIVTISNKSALVGKYIKLRSTLVSDNSVYTEKEIKIVGLL